MKLNLLIVCLAAVIAVSAPAAARQEPPAEPQVVEVPRCRPDLKLVAQVLAEYDVEHPKDIAFGQYWGATNYQQKRMLISMEPDLAHRQETVFHELIHTCYHIKGIQLPRDIEEQFVQVQARELYAELFGK
jgi:hypothetical protein